MYSHIYEPLSFTYTVFCQVTGVKLAIVMIVFNCNDLSFSDDNTVNTSQHCLCFLAAILGVNGLGVEHFSSLYGHSKCFYSHIHSYAGD